jgi:hypothetical protein
MYKLSSVTTATGAFSVISKPNDGELSMRWQVYEEWSPLSPSNPNYISSMALLPVAIFVERADAEEFARIKNLQQATEISY